MRRSRQATTGNLTERYTGCTLAGMNTKDRGYATRRTLVDAGVNEYAADVTGTVIEDTYYGQPIPAGTQVTVRRLTNSGFRGIEANVTLPDGTRATVALGNLNINR